MPTPQKHTIDSLSVWMDKPAVQQAFTNLVTPLIEAANTANTYGEEAAREFYGDEDDRNFYPKAGEVEIGSAGGFVVKVVIEPRGGNWAGQSLTHEPINAIGITNMIVDGQPLKPSKDA